MKYNETIMWKEINETPRIFKEIMGKNQETMTKLVDAIKSGKVTNFVAAARGTSDHALIFFKYVLEVSSKYTVGLAAPSVLTMYKGKVDLSNSIVIGCSQSGKGEDVLEVIKKGNEQGAITIAVTNDENSPCAKEAKFHLFCNAGEEISVAATKTFSAELFVLLWLASELSGNKANIKQLSNLGTEIEKVVPQIDELTTKYAEKFKNMKSGFVLSRGLTFSIALEATLKLQETCYIQMKGYAGSDFYHGPMAMVNENTPVIIYAGKFDGDSEIQSIVRADQIKCIEKMLSLGAPVLLVTNDCVLNNKYENCNYALINYNVPEEFSMFAFALFAQMFACKISCGIGNNPDSPRALKKVTITF
ncbi:MAG: SIS domain-containing protein [Firmicutes bacterium]|nr:SIS domain-containing protein [Candidatus Caballimonas caccae]